jgi:hypothetical protein
LDKITSIAYVLYQSSKSPVVKKTAIQLLNGDVTLRELEKNGTLCSEIIKAKSYLKKNKLDNNLVQIFVEHFLLVGA